MDLPDYLSRAPVVNNDMSEDGEQDNHKLCPEYLQNLVYKPKAKIMGDGRNTTSTSVKKRRQRTINADVKPRLKVRLQTIIPLQP